MTLVPDLPGILSADEVRETADHLASLQVPSGMIPWFPGGHCDPWNHVESAMALDVAGLHHQAEDAYEWLAAVQLPDGAWHNYYWPDGSVEEPKLDTNVCAYIATGVWHHWRCTWDRGFLDHLWPAVERALDWVLSLRRPDGQVLWAIEADGTRPWDYALLTGLVEHPARPAVRPGAVRRRRRAATGVVGRRRRDRRRHRRPARRVRPQGALGDGLVLPGAQRRARRRGGQGPARRGLGRASRWTAAGCAASATSRG